MLVKNTNVLNGKTYSLELDITKEQYMRWKSGREVVYEVFQNLNEYELTFLITGILPKDQEEMLK